MTGMGERGLGDPSRELRRVPPLGWLALGLLAQKLLPSRRKRQASLRVGQLLLAASVGLLARSAAAFRRHDTTVDPLAPERASHLVDDGPFRVTRNPMYVAMAGVLLAHGVARRSVLGLVPLAGFVVVIDKTQIEAEEQAMAAAFGPEWDRFCATTPRWIGLRTSLSRRRDGAS